MAERSNVTESFLLHQYREVHDMLDKCLGQIQYGAERSLELEMHSRAYLDSKVRLESRIAEILLRLDRIERRLNLSDANDT